MSDAVEELVAPIRAVTPLLYPMASYMTLGAILGTVCIAFIALIICTHA